MPKVRYQLRYKKCRPPKKNQNYTKFYAKFKPGDLVELIDLKQLEYNGKRAVVVGPLIKDVKRRDNKWDRYPVKIMGIDEPDRVFNVKQYNMFLKEIKTRRFRKFKETERIIESIGADEKLTVRKEAEVLAEQAKAQEEALKDGTGKTDMDVAGKDVEMKDPGSNVQKAKQAQVDSANVAEKDKEKKVEEEEKEIKVDPWLPPDRTLVGTVVEIEGEDKKHVGMTRRSRKRKRGYDKDPDDEEDDPDDTRPRKKFQLTFCRILSDIYKTFSTLQLARLARRTLECRDCHMNYPAQWGVKEPRFYNTYVKNERNGPRSCMVCQIRKGSGLAYLLFTRMCRIDVKWVKRQEEFLEQGLYWNCPKLCDTFQKVWKEVEALNL